MSNQKISIPKEHMPRLLNSMLCENLLGFERRLNSDGKHEWRGQMNDSGSWTEWTDKLEELVDFAGDVTEAIDMLQHVCSENGMGFNVVFDPQRNLLNVFILAVGPEGKPIPRVQIEGTQLASMICAAMCGLRGLSLEDQHRALFPGHYLLLNN